MQKRLPQFILTFLLLFVLVAGPAKAQFWNNWFGNSGHQHSKLSRKYRRQAKSHHHSHLHKPRRSGFNLDSDDKYWMTGLQLGSASYFGDLAPSSNRLSTEVSKTRFATSAFLSRRFARGLFAGVELGWTRIAGSDLHADEEGKESGRFTRNLHFRNNMYRLGLSAQYNPWDMKGAYSRRPAITPFVGLGAGVLYHNPQAQEEPDGEWVNLQPLETEGTSYSRLRPYVEGATGVRFPLTHHFDLGLEITGLWAFTDYLDDVSDSYPEIENFNKGSETWTAEEIQALRFSNRSGEAYFSDGTPRDPEKFGQVQTVTLQGNRQFVHIADSKDVRGNPDRNDFVINLKISVTYYLSSLKISHQPSYDNPRL